MLSSSKDGDKSAVEGRLWQSFVNVLSFLLFDYKTFKQTVLFNSLNIRKFTQWYNDLIKTIFQRHIHLFLTVVLYNKYCWLFVLVLGTSSEIYSPIFHGLESKYLKIIPTCLTSIQRLASAAVLTEVSYLLYFQIIVIICFLSLNSIGLKLKGFRKHQSILLFIYNF